MADGEVVRSRWRKGDAMRNTEQPSVTDYLGVQAENPKRGHLAPGFYFPSNDCRTATDVLSNIVPQYDKFLQITW